MNGFYPVLLQLKGKRCIVVGGGQIALRKLTGLLEAGADHVSVISPSFIKEIDHLAADGNIYCIQRQYAEGDLVGAWIVFAATNDKQLNAAIADEANRLGILVNVADRGSNGSFISPSVVRRGDLLLAVTASGASPALSQRIKLELEASYGPEYEEVTANLRRLREKVINSLMDEQVRQAVLKLAVEEVMQFNQNTMDMDEWLQKLLHRIDRGLT